jgi:hypothetical protein
VPACTFFTRKGKFSQNKLFDLGKMDQEEEEEARKRKRVSNSSFICPDCNLPVVIETHKCLHRLLEEQKRRRE